MARYEYGDGRSSKFWEIDLAGSSFTVRFGRIGTTGQEQTKSFTSVDLARKEHDKLVAEKLKKGYRPAAGSSEPTEPAPTPRSQTPAAPAPRVLRRDFYVYNEATGMLVTSKRIGGKGWENGGKEWEKAVRNGDFIPLELIQDDPFTVRVVVGGELEAQEAEEWVGRLDWKLRVPDGNLIVCGGAEYLMEQFEDETDSFMADHVRRLKVPKGEYRASLYMYMGSVNGKACIQAARGGDEPDPYGEWFRRTRPHESFPAWLHNDCVLDPSEDPGHEDEWKQERKIDDPVEHYIGFLLHLGPLEAAVKAEMPELTDGWFSTPTECRVPERIPLGIPARDIEGAPKKPDPDAVHPIDVFQHTRRFARKPLQGGPVAVPIDALQRLYRVAWFCHPWTAPQMKVDLPKDASLPDFPRFENALVTRTGDTLSVGFQNPGSQSGCIRSMNAVSQQLKALPDGSVVEVDSAYSMEKELARETPMALHRYRGTIREGTLWIDETFPAVAAARLEAALALSAQVDAGDAIDTGSVELRRKVLDSLKGHAFFSDNVAVEQGDSSVALSKPEPIMLNFVAAEVFKHSFKDTWRLLDLDAEDEEEVPQEEETRDTGRKMPPKAPRGEVVLEVPQKRLFHLSDATKLDADCQKKIADTEKELLPLGFALVADVTLTEMEYGVIRAYAQPGGGAWAALTLAPYGRGTLEFVEVYQDGATLTTTTNGMVRDEIFRDAFKSVRTNQKIADMWKDHQQRSAYLAGFHGGARTLDASARGLAADVQRSIENQETKVPRRPQLLKGDDNRAHFAADAKQIHPTAPKAVADADAAIEALGFEPVGDVVSSSFAGTVCRGYARAGGDTWAKFQLDASSTPEAQGYWEFATVFEKGACLVTTRAAMSKDEPKRKIYRILDGNSPPAKLLEQHERRRDDLARKHGAPLPVRADLESLAAEVEAAFVRLMG